MQLISVGRANKDSRRALFFFNFSHLRFVGERFN